MKAQEVRDFLAKNSAKLKELHANIHRTFALRSKSDEGWQVWEEACTLFHQSYDQLAFPGGLVQAFTSLKAGDPALAEAALIYCEVRPYYFRSGYHRNKFLRLLGHISLPPHLETRLKAIKDDVHRRKMKRHHQLNQLQNNANQLWKQQQTGKQL